MALVLNEEQQMLRDAARDFLQSRSPVAHLRELRDGDDTIGFSPDRPIMNMSQNATMAKMKLKTGPAKTMAVR